MHLSEFIKPQMVWPALLSKDKNTVISELSDKIAQNIESISADKIKEALLNREKLGSTGIQDGIAIPHAKIPGLNNIIVACGRSEDGIDFQSLDHKPTHLFFVLLAPELATTTHLKILARLSKLLKNSSFIKNLLNAKEASEIYKFITQEDEN